MNNRRDFLVKGSLAATAVLFLKPLETLAGDGAGFDFFSNDSNKLLFLHTKQLNPYGDSGVIQQIKNIKNKHTNALLLKASGNNGEETTPLHYDASLTDTSAASINNGYKILQKGNIKTGIISATPGENNVIEKVNRLAAYLKKEKNCTVVVCLSQLGYKNNGTPDDITLAKYSTDVDIIIGGHPENFHKHPIIALNSRNAEVIIHAASAETFAFGKIEMDFDSKGRKKQVSFANHS